MKVNTAEKPHFDNKSESLNDKTARYFGVLLAHFNQLTGRNCGYSEPRFKLLRHWVKQGYDLDDFKRVTEYKYNQWKDDKNMKQYIELDTFWRRVHFEKNLEQAREVKDNSKPKTNYEGNFFKNTGTYSR